MSRQQHVYQVHGAGVEIPADLQTIIAHLDALDLFIHEPTRLRLLAFLAKQPEAVSFQTLGERLWLRSGTLSIQLKLLGQAGLVVTEKRKEGRYAGTTVALTPVGREAFTRHRDHVLAALDLMSKEE